MNDALKMALTSLVKSIVDRGIVALGMVLLSNGWLVQGQSAGFNEVGSGLVMVVLGAIVGWYRDHGKALMQAEIDRLNAKVDAMTKAVQVPHPNS